MFIKPLSLARFFKRRTGPAAGAVLNFLSRIHRPPLLALVTSSPVSILRSFSSIRFLASLRLQESRSPHSITDPSCFPSHEAQLHGLNRGLGLGFYILLRMRRKNLILIALLLPFLFIASLSEATKVDDPKSLPVTAEKKNGSNGTEVVENVAVPDRMKTDGDKKGADQGGEMKGGIGGRGDKKEDGGKKKDEDLEVKKSVEKDDSKGSLGGETHGKAGNVEETGVEECDPANRCIDENKKFVACLRVPGIDSLDLSLLIQNKGIGPLGVNIVAPKFVSIEQTSVKLQPKENKEVKVSVRDDVNDTVIVLKAGGGSCSLNFQNMISSSIRKSETSASSIYSRLLTPFSLICILLVATVLIGVAWLYVRFRRMHHQGNPIYQKVEMGLPVSSGGKKEASGADGWDNSWSDGWDDEEAPVTPSRPVANPSSKGLAARRSNKDGWKD